MPRRLLTDITEIIIHCADTPNGDRTYDIGDIDEWHKDRGFVRPDTTKRPHLKHVGYHYVINPDGSIAVGRSHKEIGAHAAGRNAASIGICLIGRDKYTVAAWYALADVVDDLCVAYPRIRNIIGHNDVTSKKTCPGFKVADWLKADKKPLEGHLYAV
jgi:N-acetylmuramoyl-L-alanine amidase